MADNSIQCRDCGVPINGTLDEAQATPCPSCRSMRRVINVSVMDEVAIKEQMEMKLKDQTSTARGKIRIEQICGDDLHRKSGKWYKKVRVIDRGNNLYLETVTDPTTGEIIHECKESLTDHFGHGSAKRESE